MTEPAKPLTEFYATNAALALADARRAEHLHRMAANRDLIGQANGILMVTHRVDADAAFALLLSASQRLNVKVIDLADVVATTGALPTE